MLGKYAGRVIVGAIAAAKWCSRQVADVETSLPVDRSLRRYVVRTTPGRVSDQITQMAIAIISSDQNG